MESNEKNNKKAIITLVVGIGVLLVLIFSATFAYFSVTSRNNFGTKTITGTAEATGSVALNGTSTSLRLNLSGTDMMKGEDDITYWATSDGTPSTTQNVVTIGSTQVTGPGYYNCDYTLSVTGTGTNNMYTAFQGMSGKSTEQIVLKIGDTKYDFNTANLFPITINGTLNGVTGSSVKSLTAEFYIVNKETVVQDALAGKDLNITITATNFSCTALEDPNNYLDKTRLHDIVYIRGLGEGSLTFLNTVNVPEGDECGEPVDISEKQNGSIMLSAYTNNCMYDEVTVYIGQDGGVLAPPDSSYLFYDVNNNMADFKSMDFRNLDTSHVTNMSNMFTSSIASSIDISMLDTSNVINMEDMFLSVKNNNNGVSINLSGLNLSKVTSMNSMFLDSCINSLNISNVNTSNLVDVSSMFENINDEYTCSYNNLNLNLSSLNTSNVTNMSNMFAFANVNSIDISSFNTSNVTNMLGMFTNSSVATIYASNNFVTTSVQNRGATNGGDYQMFHSCSSLVGGNGTAYSSSYEDSTYARIDAPGTPGYFTAKNS